MPGLPQKLPRHIAIIMDGNGRWAERRHLPRFAGHRAGQKVVREIVQACVDQGIEILTLFAFSSENWRRPIQEVNYLMQLFFHALQTELKLLQEHNVQLQIIGNRSNFNPKLVKRMQQAQAQTANNTGLKLIIAADYSGQWDILQAVQQIAEQVAQGDLLPSDIDANTLQSKLATNGIPVPDLLIRTSGEQRISNFFLWQLAYTELFFTEVWWPDFTLATLNEALAFYASRQRRFGHTSEQMERLQSA